MTKLEAKRGFTLTYKGLWVVAVYFALANLIVVINLLIIDREDSGHALVTWIVAHKVAKARPQMDWVERLALSTFFGALSVAYVYFWSFYFLPWWGYETPGHAKSEELDWGASVVCFIVNFVIAYLVFPSENKPEKNESA